MLGFGFPFLAQASVIEGIATGIIGVASYYISYVIGYIGGIALAVVSWFVNVARTLNVGVLDDPSSIVPFGWQITRDIANLGFVLVIIVIAIAVILRMETYGSRQLLVRLIAAAIIVNFSLAIMGAILQFSEVLTTFFLSKIPSGDDLGASLAGAFNAQRFFLNPNSFNPGTSADASATSAILLNIASVLFSAAFVVVATIVIGTFAVLLFIRYLYLVFLAIGAPMIWLFWVVPDLNGIFKKWWSKFLDWTFFQPASAFFIYLSFFAVKQLQNTPIGQKAPAGGFFEQTFLVVATQGAQIVVIAGLMLGGLIVAKSMGIEGANVGLNLASKARKGAQAWAGRKATQAATRPLRGEWGRKATAFMQKTPLLRTAGTYLAKQRLAFEKQSADEAKKKLPKDLREQALQYGSLTTSNAGRVQIMDNLVKDRKARSKKAKTEQEKLSNMDTQITSKTNEISKKDANIKDLQQKYEESQRMGGTLTDEYKAQLDLEIKAKETLVVDRDKLEKQRKDALENEGSDYNKAMKAKKEIDDAIASLPKGARDALQSEGFEVNKTKLHTRYGKKDEVTPTESAKDKAWEAVKKEVKDEGGGEKKEKEKGPEDKAA